MPLIKLTIASSNRPGFDGSHDIEIAWGSKEPPSVGDQIETEDATLSVRWREWKGQDIGGVLLVTGEPVISVIERMHPRFAESEPSQGVSP